MADLTPHAPDNQSAVFSQHYQVRQRLGEGGFGQVFAAWDTRLCRRVAIKQLKSHQHGDLLQEARLAATLQHPAFVRIFTIEHDAGYPSVVMELIQGQNLHQLLQTHPPTLTQALAMVGQIAAAMAEAHEAGLVHGDLKPANLMLDDKGRMRILDFGLATLSDPDLTRVSGHLDPQGTVRYMAPELLLGQPITVQTDIYALGVILFELLSATPIFPHLHGMALASTILQSSSHSWDFPATLPPGICRLIIAMTAREPAKRLQSMSQLLESLTDLQHGRAEPTQREAGPPFLLQWPVLALLRKMTSDSVRRRASKSWLLPVLFGLVAGCWQLYPYLEHQLVSLQPFSAALSMQRGLAALKQFDRPGSLSAAEQEFSRILQHDRQNAAAVAGLSLVYSFRYSGDGQDNIWLDKANASAQMATRLNPTLALSHVASGRVATLQHNFAGARQSYRQALLLEPHNFWAHFGNIDVLLSEQHYQDAAAQIRAAQAIFPAERMLQDALGRLYYETNDYRRAEQAFRASIALEPDAVLAYANLNAALSMQNRFAEALQALQDGLKIRPSAMLYSNLGSALFFQKQYVAAVDAFSRAVHPQSGNPDNYLAWANLGDGLLWLPNKKAEALQAFQQARQLLSVRLARQPDNLELLSRMALYNARLGDVAASRQQLQRLRPVAGQQPHLWFRLGLTYELLNERTAALDAVRLALLYGYPAGLLAAEPDLLALRADPRFDTISSTNHKAIQ